MRTWSVDWSLGPQKKKPRDGPRYESVGLQKLGPQKPTTHIKKRKNFILVYISYFSSGLLYERSKFLYDEKKQVLYIFECSKIWRIHRVCQSTMDMMKMLNSSCLHSVESTPPYCIWESPLLEDWIISSSHLPLAFS